MLTDFMMTPKSWEHLQPHPLAKAASFIEKETVEVLAQFMRDHGYDSQEHVTLIREGRELLILDGILRHAAAVRAGEVPSFRLFTGKNPRAFVAKKAHRQHLNVSQRAMIAALLADAPSGGISKKDESANLQTTPISVAARTMNVGERTVADARKVLDAGTLALQEAVKDGTVSVSDAAAIIDEPAKAQNEAVKKVRKRRAKTVKEAISPNETRRSEPKDFFDDDGNVVPVWLHSVWRALPYFDAAAKTLTPASEAMYELESHTAAMAARTAQGKIDVMTFGKRIKDGLRRVREMRPALVCVECNGAEIPNCRACAVNGSLGWFTKEQAEARKKETASTS